jgi:hypothetical protein
MVGPRILGVIFFGLMGLLFARWTLEALRTGRARMRCDMVERATQPVLFRVAVGFLVFMTVVSGYAVLAMVLDLHSN